MTAINPGKLAKRLKRLYRKGVIEHATEVVTEKNEVTNKLFAYKDDCVGFCKDVLGVDLTTDQQTIARAKGRVKVNAGHSVGKTHLAACILLHRFYTRDKCVVVTTAPTQRDVIDLLWNQVRILHRKALLPLGDFFIGPRAPEMFDDEEHWAKGYTASKGESFQGRHLPCMIFIFDECEAIDPHYWETTGTMYKPNEDHLWLAIGNPVTTSSQSYQEDLAVDFEGNQKWDIYTLNALNHPNISAQLAGSPPPVPAAVTLDQVNQWFADWADKVPLDDIREGDIQWPPGSGVYYRPGPLFKGRVLGERPTEGVNTVWGTIAWQNACKPKYNPQWCWQHSYGITIGVDVAVYGDDYSAIHVRTGPLSLHHEYHNGWGPEVIADRIKSLCVEWASWYNGQALVPARPQLLPGKVKVIIELDGPGVSVLSHCNKYGEWSGIKVAESSEMVDMQGRPMYNLLRSEMWFEAEKKARKGLMDLSRLPKDILAKLRKELLTPSYKLVNNGTLQVESKDDIKKRMSGHSPDNADAMLVCYTDAMSWSPKALFKQQTAE